MDFLSFSTVEVRRDCRTSPFRDLCVVDLPPAVRPLLLFLEDVTWHFSIAMGDTSAPAAAADEELAAMEEQADDEAGVDELLEEDAVSTAGWPTMTGGGVRERSMMPQSTNGVGDQSLRTLNGEMNYALKYRTIKNLYRGYRTS